VRTNGPGSARALACSLRRLAAIPLIEKVRDREGAIASTRGACGPQNYSAALGIRPQLLAPLSFRAKSRNLSFLAKVTLSEMTGSSAVCRSVGEGGSVAILACRSHTRDAEVPPTLPQLFRGVENSTALLAANDLLPRFDVHGRGRCHFHMATGADLMFKCNHGRIALTGEKPVKPIQ
jgi:hypothetical protein